MDAPIFKFISDMSHRWPNVYTRFPWVPLFTMPARNNNFTMYAGERNKFAMKPRIYTEFDRPTA